MTAAGLPLLAARDLASPLAWRDGAAISSGQFIAEAQVLAERLPASGRPLNLCQDRYHFALGLAAALLRGQTSLMPPNALPETLRQVPPDGAAPYVMSDSPAGAGKLPVLRIERPAGVAPAREVPLLPSSLQAVCLLTSGSTGAPQPHAKRWGPLMANIRAEAERLAELMARPSIAGLNVVATVPAQHSYGLESTVLLAWLGGAAFDAGRPFYPADIAEALARLPRPRALVTTPFHLKTLLLSGVVLPPVDLVLSATAPLSPQVAATAEAAFGGLLAEIYGCTEAGQVAARRTTAGETWTTLGELRITHEPGPGPDDERWIVAGGHVVEPTPLADVLELQVPRDGRHFRLLGRANDLIHVAGKRSSLAHLNFHLNRIDGVEDGAFWLPDDEAEGVVRPVAFVVAPTLTPRQVIGALRAQLDPAFVPRRVVQVAALPREATGKLTAAALRRFALQALATTAAAADPATGPSGATAFEISSDHPAFAGHFPGRPVLPGAVLLSLVLEALERQPALRSRLGPQPCIDSAKFLAPVGPGARLVAQLRAHGSGGVAFELQQHGIPVARGQLSAGVAA